MMRRTITLRQSLHALIAAPLLMAAWPAVVPAHAEEAPFISVVTGLAPDDLLNVRAKPSPIGKTEARLAVGASVRNLGCNDIDGHPWCKIESDNPKATGWTPARYLVPLNPATVPDQAADTPATAPAEGGTGATPDAPDLTARLGSTTQPASPETKPKTAAEIAMQDAYGLALAANGTLQIPCARYVGQPMAPCAANVTRKDTDKADVTVTWPDGGSRVISFDAGLPASSDAGSDFRFTREGKLNMIRIGVSERFEIMDTVVLGD
ncbi:MAG: SH3 domain-containing protein [Mesorhizobium sp.]|uniref:SH3 domain-containing protein n=1 Tax=Mesorhizobium sp. TaxID=1871066 RepID=UPI0011FA0F79|nr:SH3 domain-containing protein [Mesorhizobium sp.]TIT36668.1 MAG: SH3 domain-containing protein [Mesorhizobium sp.]